MFDKRIIKTGRNDVYDGKYTQFICQTIAWSVPTHYVTFGNASRNDTSLLSEIDRDISNIPTQSIQDYVDTLVD